MPAATGESEPGIDLKQLEEIEKRFDKFRIQVAPDLTIRGSIHQGFAVNTFTCDEMGQGGEPPTPTTGACCLPDGTCEEVTVAQCLEDGGTFVGGSCADADCPQPTGACCVGSDCTIETESDCTDMGGTYQGDDTTCDPNPCEMPPCCEGAFEHDGHFGRMFLTYTRIRSGSFVSTGNPGFNITESVSANDIQSYDSDCNFSETYIASSSASGDGLTTPCGPVSNESCFISLGDLGGFCGPVCFPSPPPSYTDTGVVVDSATDRHRYEDTNGGCTACSQTGHDYTNETLSDECTPP